MHTDSKTLDNDNVVVKRILGMCFILTVGFLLTACSSSGSTSGQNKPANKPQPPMSEAARQAYERTEFLNNLKTQRPSQNNAAVPSEKPSFQLPSSMPPNPIRGQKTWEYWKKAFATWQQNNPFDRELMDKLKIREQVVTGMRESGNIAQRLAAKWRELPVQDVDLEAITFVSKTAEIVGQYALLCDESVDSIVEFINYAENTNADEVLVEAFIRGFFGDPLGKFNEVNDQFKQFKERRAKIYGRWRSLMDKMNQVMAQLPVVQTSLSQKYNREFR